MSATTKGMILVGAAAACFSVGIVLARVVFGDADGRAGPVDVVHCDPPCPEGHECLKGICISPPASMPAMAELKSTDAAVAESGPSGVPTASVGYQRHLKCEGPRVDDAKCDHTSMPHYQYAMKARNGYLTACYEKVYAEHPDQVGIVKLLVNVDYIARTSSPSIHRESNVTDPDIHKCVIKASYDAMNYDNEHLFDKELVAFTISFGLRPKDYGEE